MPSPEKLAAALNFQGKRPPFGDISNFTPEEQAALQYHRDQLTNNTALINQNGSLTSFMGAVVTRNKRAMILPLYWHGKVRDQAQAMNFATESGIAFPEYKSVDEALAAEERMHKIMEQDSQSYAVSK